MGFYWLMIVMISIQPFRSHHISKCMTKNSSCQACLPRAPSLPPKSEKAGAWFWPCHSSKKGLPSLKLTFSHLIVDGKGIRRSFLLGQFWPIFRCEIVVSFGECRCVFFFVVDVFFLFSFQASAKRLFMFCFFSKDQNNWPPLGGVFFFTNALFFKRNFDQRV